MVQSQSNWLASKKNVKTAHCNTAENMRKMPPARSDHKAISSLKPPVMTIFWLEVWDQLFTKCLYAHFESKASKATFWSFFFEILDVLSLFLNRGYLVLFWRWCWKKDLIFFEGPLKWLFWKQNIIMKIVPWIPETWPRSRFRVNLHRVLLVLRTMDFRLKGPKGQATLRGVPADRPLNEFLQDRLGGIG